MVKWRHVSAAKASVVGEQIESGLGWRWPPRSWQWQRLLMPFSFVFRWIIRRDSPHEGLESQYTRGRYSGTNRLIGTSGRISKSLSPCLYTERMNSCHHAISTFVAHLIPLALLGQRLVLRLAQTNGRFLKYVNCRCPHGCPLTLFSHPPTPHASLSSELLPSALTSVSLPCLL